MRYKIYSEYLKQKYGTKVYKLPVNLPLTCPNRDGNCGVNGCAFCGEKGAGFENLSPALSVSEQLAANKAYIGPKYKATKFIAYFQNFSNTYLPVPKFKELIQAACIEDIVGIAIATRPDCINDQYLDVLAEIGQSQQVDITVELGLQTVNYHTLTKVNRGHTLAEFIDAVLRIKSYHLPICTHLILNLPWDDMEDVTETAKVISALGVDQVKLHALYIVKNTLMADWFVNGQLTMISKEEYVNRVVTFLEYLHPDTVIQRLLGRAPAAETLFANWQTAWWKIRDEIEDTLEVRQTYQGRLCNYLNGKAVQKFL
jgi:radical SAM protein (TIGR01212 family)